MNDNKVKLARLRKALYALFIAIAGCAVVFEYVDQTQAAALLLVAGGLLGVAFYNVDSGSDTNGDGV